MGEDTEITESEATTQPEAEWNPDKAGAEMAALFEQVDIIMSQAHYQEESGTL